MTVDMSVLQYKDELIWAGATVETGEWKRHYATAMVNQRLAAVRALAQEAADQDLLSLLETAAIQRVRGEKSQASGWEPGYKKRDSTEFC